MRDVWEVINWAQRMARNIMWWEGPEHAGRFDREDERNGADLGVEMVEAG